ncbi:MAG: LytTR family DNA-binding domain-containing protein [Bacteroidetes bacterium]|nr:LytTR family DNA-binding domain-containing protein [Bacteroidota bacterium]
MNLSGIIIDDEQSAIDIIKKYLLTVSPDIQIIGEANDFDNGVKIINDLNPDILFLDIDLRNNKSGFDILNAINHSLHKVIFITAHNTHAIKAFKYCAVDYLLKPVDPDELKTAVEKAKKSLSKEIFSEQLQELMNTVKHNKKSERIFVKTQDSISAIDIKDIVHVTADGSYSDIYIMGKKKITASKNIKEFDDILSTAGFYRPHQSHLINMQHFDSFKKNDGGYICLKDGSEIPVSTRKKQEFLEMLKSI